MNNNTSEKYYLTQEQREILEEKLRDLYQKEFSLRQSLLQEKEKSSSEQEEIFLELLDLFDALEFFLNYLKENPEPNPQFIKKLPKTVGNIQKKLLSILKRRQVELIDYQGDKADFSLCQVVDCEIREDLEEQTITKIIRQGFRFDNKLLRPLEVIIAKKEP